jgi:hypothetical protein
MALDAIDPLDHVRTVLERVRLRGLREPEHTRARGEHEREDRKKPQENREGEARLHRISSVRDNRRSAFVS